MEVDWKIVLEFFKTLLSWPPMAVGILLIVVYNFKASIQDWLEKLHIKHGETLIFPFHQAIQKEKKPALPEVSQEVSSGETPLISSDNPPSSFEEKIKTMTKDELENLATQWRSNAYLWEYKYLSLYLVPNTQMVLGWFYEQKRPIAFEFFDNIWKNSIPLSSERTAILTALQNHYLLQISNGLISLTEKGKEYYETTGKSLTDAIMSTN